MIGKRSSWFLVSASFLGRAQERLGLDLDLEPVPVPYDLTIPRDDFEDRSSEFVPAGEMMVNYRDIVRNVMAREKALYEGHAVAAVAATSNAIAKQALKLIEVDYEPLPHVIDAVEAMKPDAPLLHEDMFTEGVEPAPTKPSNVAKRHEVILGDVEAGFAEGHEASRAGELFHAVEGAGVGHRRIVGVQTNGGHQEALRTL